MADGEGQWRLRDIITLLVILGVLATIATVTVVGGGGFLLLISPLLLLFSPVLVPLGIFTAVVVGGFLAFAGFIGSMAWLYNYATGGRPPLAEQADAVTGRVKDTTGWATDKISEATGLAQHKAGETYGYLAEKTGVKSAA